MSLNGGSLTQKGAEITSTIEKIVQWRPKRLEIDCESLHRKKENNIILIFFFFSFINIILLLLLFFDNNIILVLLPAL